MRRRTRVVLTVGALGAALLAAAAGWVIFGDAHRGYRTLAPEVFHPTFFPRWAAARAQDAEWVRHAAGVAQAYVGESRLCPQQAVIAAATTASRATITVARQCPYSAYSTAVLQEFRVELEQHAGRWEIVWAGLRLKCGINQHPLGVFLLSHNPFRAAPSAWSQALSAWVVGLANTLNPWQTECL